MQQKSNPYVTTLAVVLFLAALVMIAYVMIPNPNIETREDVDFYSLLNHHAWQVASDSVGNEHFCLGCLPGTNNQDNCLCITHQPGSAEIMFTGYISGQYYRARFLNNVMKEGQGNTKQLIRWLGILSGRREHFQQLPKDIQQEIRKIVGS